MGGKICYLGDGEAGGAAGYLIGIMLHYGLAFDHVPSNQPPPAALEREPYALYVVSDYPAAQFGDAAMSDVADQVAQGAGLLMLGGWDSYFGRAGEYHNSPLAAVLPVVMAQSDDRRNFAQPCLVKQLAEHPVLDDLPWDRPPGIGGLNEITPKPDAETLLAAVPFTVQRAGHDFVFLPEAEWPLLVVGTHGRGRTVALATDVAPHWVGGLVDWGDGRTAQDIPGGDIEVGDCYARFFRNLLVWTGRIEGERD
jgi:hypothetical protein